MASAVPRRFADQRQQDRDTNLLPPHIFAENMRPPVTLPALPQPGERLYDTHQLAYCLGMLQTWQSVPSKVTDPAVRTWLHTIEKDDDEKERLTTMATNLVNAFTCSDLKDFKTVSEIAHLVPVLERDSFRHVFQRVYDGIEQSNTLNVHQLWGLAQLIENVPPNYIVADDLVKILELLSTRLRDVPRQLPHTYQLSLTVSHVLDALVNTRVQDLDRDQIPEPLSAYLNSLQDNPNRYLVYQAAYSFQALQCILDNDNPWQAVLQQTENAAQCVSGLDSTMKAFDLNGFIESLGGTGEPPVVELVQTAYEVEPSLEFSGKRFLDNLTESHSFERKQSWYPALRGLDALLRDGRLADFRKLVCEAPCRNDPAFQWGVCQRLGSLATNSKWDVVTRQSAVAFLEEIYKNDAVWGQNETVKEWVIDILTQLLILPGSAMECK